MMFRRKSFKIPDDKVLLETEHWVVNQRMDSHYPGYMIVGAKEDSFRISCLSDSALESLGRVLSAVEKRIYQRLSPEIVIVNKLGFSKGFSCHFHLIPIYRWVYKAIKKHENYNVNEPDGSDFTLFVSRQYCEGNDPLPSGAETVESAIEKLNLKGITIACT